MPLTEPGIGRRPMTEVIENLRFAKQRFDSTAAPVVKMALMILPLATLLAYIASDTRNEREQRERAKELLPKLDSKFCLALGVSADWGVICQWFLLRLFDVREHDSAQSRSQIDAFIETLDAVFTDGRVFKFVRSPALLNLGGGQQQEEDRRHLHLPPVGPDNVKLGFITTRVMKNLKKNYVFYANNNRQILLWSEPARTFAQELLHRAQNVAKLTKDRLEADFPRTDERSALSSDIRQAPRAQRVQEEPPVRRDEEELAE